MIVSAHGERVSDKARGQRQQQYVHGTPHAPAKPPSAKVCKPLALPRLYQNKLVSLMSAAVLPQAPFAHRSLDSLAGMPLSLPEAWNA